MRNDDNIFALTKQDTAVLKGIAIIAMLMHHLWGCPPTGIEPYTGVLGFLGNVGKVCVAIFLFCSGYGLSVGYSKVMGDLESTNCDWKSRLITTLKFLAKRFVKFYTGYWPIFLIFVPISIFVFNRSLSDAYVGLNPIKRFIMDFLAINGSRCYNPTWWFNYLIVLLYLLFPILFGGIKRLGCLGVLISVLLMIFENKLAYINHYHLLLWQCPFVLGVFLHLKEESFSYMYNKLPNWLLCAFVVALIVFVSYWRTIVDYDTSVKIDSILTILLVIGVILLREYFPYMKKTFSLLGKHSMNIYMTHTFFFSYWFSSFFYSCELGGGVNIIALLTICLFVSIIIEWMKELIRWNKLSNIIIEKIDKL